MGAALGWGVVAASSLLLGMLLDLARLWPSRLIGLALAFGAGVLVSAVSFELSEEGINVGGAASVWIGLAEDALAYARRSAWRGVGPRLAGPTPTDEIYGPVNGT